MLCDCFFPPALKRQRYLLSTSQTLAERCKAMGHRCFQLTHASCSYSFRDALHTAEVTFVLHQGHIWANRRSSAHWSSVLKADILTPFSNTSFLCCLWRSYSMNIVRTLGNRRCKMGPFDRFLPGRMSTIPWFSWANTAGLSKPLE